MATYDEIETSLTLADAYVIEISEEMYAADISCGDGDPQKILCLMMLSTQLRADIAAGINNETTTILYGKLLSILSQFSGAALAIDPNVIIPGQTIIVVAQAGDIMQTDVVYPGDGEFDYDFPELIGQDVLTVYRGVGTTLRVQTGAPTDDFAQVDPLTGKITVKYPFTENEGLWVEYKTVL